VMSRGSESCDAGTLGRGPATGKELCSADLDRLNLKRYIQRFAGDAAEDLSWGGIQLYERVLALC
jgi:hypothetical protein